MIVAGLSLADACAQKSRNQMCGCRSCQSSVRTDRDRTDEFIARQDELYDDLEIIMGGIPVMTSAERAEIAFTAVHRVA